MVQAMHNNRRALERFKLRVPATLEVLTEDEKLKPTIIKLFTSDICAGGAFFHTDKPLPEGTSVAIDLVLSIDQIKQLEGRQAYIEVKGRVVRTDGDGMAICFDKGYRIQSL